MIRRLTKRELPIDSAIAVLLIVAVMVEIAAGTSEAGTFPRASDAWGTALAVAAIVPVAWRRSRPVTVLAITFVLYLVRLAAGYEPIGAVDAAALLCVYSVGVHAPRPLANVARLVAGFALASGIAATMGVGWVSPATGALMFGTWIAFAWIGEGGYHRRRYREALEERAARLETEQEEQARLAVRDERARISREFHDVWAHTLSLVVVQAGAALTVLDDSPDDAKRSLTAIQLAGRRALGEVRRLIAIEPVPPGSPGGPTPGVDDLPELIREMRDAGLDVELATAGLGRELPKDLGMNAFRIVQQALTNVLSHGGVGATAQVEVTAHEDGLEITVTDDGRGTPIAGHSRGGRGVVGMRERVALYGGTICAEARPEGGFAVRAHLPIELVS